MTSKARQYRPGQVKLLCTLSGNECAAPDCKNKLTARDRSTLVSKIAHIQAASENGPRYNPNMTDDERRDFSNLILLCDECHTMVDKSEDVYTVEVLQEWKEDHEARATYDFVEKNSSQLARVVKIISQSNLDSDMLVAENLPAFEIVRKLEYNSVVRNRPLIEENVALYAQLNTIYQELEVDGSFRKINLLRNIRSTYLSVRGAHLEKYGEANISADDMFDDVQQELFKLVEDHDGIAKDDLVYAVTIIMVDAFMRCKILERPV